MTGEMMTGEMMTPRQIAIMGLAFTVLAEEGISDDEMERILSQSIPPEVMSSMSEQRLSLAALMTLAGAAIRVECNEMFFEAIRFVYLAGWNAAIEKDFIEEITAEDL